MSRLDVKSCTICLDEAVAFVCTNNTCDYKICGPCIKDAFEDRSGTNSATCPLCETDTDIDMIKAICGGETVADVERKVRFSVEFNLKHDLMNKEKTTRVCKETNLKARNLFNKLAEDVLMKCPRCKIILNISIISSCIELII